MFECLLYQLIFIFEQVPVQVTVEKCVDVPKEVCQQVPEKVAKEVCGDESAVRSEDFTLRGLMKQ
jgi:hypothetical protein